MAIIAVAPTTEPELRSMPPVMMTWVTPMAMMPTIETCRMMIDSRAWLKIASTLSRVLNRNSSPMMSQPSASNDDHDQDEAEEDVQLGRPVALGGVEGQPADAVRCLSHVPDPLRDGPSPTPPGFRPARRAGRVSQAQFLARKSPMFAGVTSWNGM